MNIILATNQHPMSIAIRETTHSTFSHVAVMDGDNVIEANPNKGVCSTPFHIFQKFYPLYEIRQMDGDVSKAKELIGQAYDFLGLAGQAYGNREVQDPHKYFCSEVVAVAATGVNSSKGHMLLPDHFIALSWPCDYQDGVK